jgi:hypothetical protein
MIRHREMDIKPNLFTVMSAVARDADGKHNRPCFEVKDFWAVELNDARGVFLVASRSFITILWGI